MVHIYCGDGKGKTSAAFGAALRAAGNEMNVLIAQFLKCGTSGELEILRSLDRVSVLVSDRADKFIWNMNEKERIEVKKENQIWDFDFAASNIKLTARNIAALLQIGHSLNR